jgi:uncharacterized membrane protein
LDEIDKKNMQNAAKAMNLIFFPILVLLSFVLPSVFDEYIINVIAAQITFFSLIIISLLCRILKKMS